MCHIQGATVLTIFSGTVLCFFFASCSQKGDPRIAERAQQKSAPSPTTTVGQSTGGRVSGTIHFSGAVPKATNIDMSMDPGCRGENQTETYVVNHGGLANVVVYVKEGLTPQLRYFLAPGLTIDQKGCRYVPHVAVTMANQPVHFTNSDPATHNIHPDPKNNPKWNESQMPTSPTIVKQFMNPELMIPIQCNQHPWMRMYLTVLPNPYFAVSDAEGHFALPTLPPGDYTLAAIHEKLGEQTMHLHLGAEEAKSGADFTFTAQ
jgi:hypothetical protein